MFFNQLVFQHFALVVGIYLRCIVATSQGSQDNFWMLFNLGFGVFLFTLLSATLAAIDITVLLPLIQLQLSIWLVVAGQILLYETVVTIHSCR